MILEPCNAVLHRAWLIIIAGRRVQDGIIVDFKNLRQEVMDLQKTNRALRKELDDLKKKVEAKEPAPPASGKKAKPAKSK